MTVITPAPIIERAVLVAFRAAWAEYATSPLFEAEDIAYARVTATSTAHHELSQAFPEPEAEHLAKALARAALAHFCPDVELESE